MEAEVFALLGRYTEYVTDSKKEFISWTYDNSEASYEMFRITWNLKFHYRFYNPNTSTYPEVDQCNPRPPILFLEDLILY
jgi:hypothetical protein